MSKLIQRSPQVVGRQLESTLFVAHLQSNRIFELNETGARIWELLERSMSQDELGQILAEEYDASPASIAKDLETLVSELLAEGVLEKGTTPPTSALRDLEIPGGAWVLRWDAESRFLPDLISVGTHASVAATLSEAGDFVAFDGYLFEPAERGEAGAQRLAAAFLRRGSSMVDELSGSFTAAIWERRQNQLYVFRDAVGLQPCFYFWNGRTLLLSTTVEGLLSQPEVPNQVNATLLAEYVFGLTCSQQTEETYFQHIRRVPPGHIMRVREGQLSIERYWDPLPTSFTWARAEEVATFETLLERAVSRCMSVGGDSIALSGGFDSIAIACIAARLARDADRQAPASLSLHFEGGSVDESATQRAVASALGMPQQMAAFPSLDSTEVVNKALAHSAALSGPILSPWQWMYEDLLGQARERGGGVMMGTGGDDLLICDPTYAADLLARGQLRGLYELVRAWQRSSSSSPWHVARHVAWRFGLRALLVENARSRFAQPFAALSKMLGRDLRTRMRALGASSAIIEALLARQEASTPLASAATDGRYVSAMRAIVGSPLMIRELEQSACWSARSGVELLYPYFDRELIDLALRIRPEQLYAQGWMKTPVRRVVGRHLSQVAIPQKKVDFSVPGDALLRRGGRQSLERLGGAPWLIEAGICSPEVLKNISEGYLAGRGHGQFWQVWGILSAEAWVQARI